MFGAFEGRRYVRCGRCHATLLDQTQLPSGEQERAHYQTHENDPADPGYRAFLARLARPLIERLASPQAGLDYGCGPGPALAAMLQEHGHDVALFDPFFAPDRAPLARCYDFITCSEVAEHFHHPAHEFARLDRLLRPGGLLALMTMFQTDDARFGDWHYRRDPTHVAFYRRETLAVVGQDHGWSYDFPAPNVVIFAKPQ